MSDHNATEQVTEELIGPGADTLGDAEKLGDDPWEMGSAPSLPSIDSQHASVSF